MRMMNENDEYHFIFQFKYCIHRATNMAKILQIYWSCQVSWKSTHNPFDKSSHKTGMKTIHTYCTIHRTTDTCSSDSKHNWLWACLHTHTHTHTHSDAPVHYSHTPNSMWRGREDQCVNTTKPGWWPPRGMTRWEILSAWPLIPVAETDPPGRRGRENGGEETERQESGWKKKWWRKVWRGRVMMKKEWDREDKGLRGIV